MSTPTFDGLADGGPEAARSAAPAPVGLPRQNNNNSTTSLRRKYKFKVLNVGGDRQLNQDRDGRYWELDPQHTDSDKFFRYGDLNNAEAKAAYILRGQVSDFFDYWGRAHCGFFTLTDAACRHPTEFNHCFDSWKTHHGAWIKGYIRVLQPQCRGAPHYHVLTAVGWDMRPALFDWEAYFGAQNAFAAKDWANFKKLRAQYVASVPPETREIWKLCRKTMPIYQLGRAEFLPIRKDKEAVSEYIGRYLESGMRIRLHEWKGCRRVERDRRTAKLWNHHHREFAWVSPGASIWRHRLGELAAAVGIVHFDEFKARFGPKWAYRLRERVLLANEEGWQEFLTLLRQHSHLTSAPAASANGLKFAVV